MLWYWRQHEEKISGWPSMFPVLMVLEVLPALFGLVILAFGAFYKLIEWWVALASGEDAVVFLATQGYIWDT